MKPYGSVVAGTLVLEIDLRQEMNMSYNEPEPNGENILDDESTGSLKQAKIILR